MRPQFTLGFLLLLAGCRQADPPISIHEVPSSDRFADRAVDYLLSRQSDDGAWRSDVYGHFRDGDALTPLVVVSLKRAPESPRTNAAIARGLAWLGRFVRDEGIDPDAHFHYPVYTAALTIQALGDPRQTQQERIREAWVKFLKSYQMTEEIGWQPSDWQFGGWGYAGIIPYRPREGPIPEALDANISATAYALDALRAAGDLPSKVADKAKIFVGRCQNFARNGKNSAAEDGGFFFVPLDPFRNKAGLADGKGRFRSYGSATADGTRCLLALKMTGEPEFAAARNWFDTYCPTDKPFRNEGAFADDREANRNAALFYAAASTNELLHAEALTLSGRRRQRIREALLRLQNADGSWQNELNQVREDDPLLATALALMAIR